MKNFKITYALNVWNTYGEILLNFEILKKLNEGKKLFAEINCISMGGYPEPPSPKDSIYSVHYNIPTPQIATGRHNKYQALYRVLEGFKFAYKIALERGDDFVIVTNSDAWILDIDKFHQLLSSPKMQDCAIGCRIGVLTGLKLNMGPMLPQIDDHFLVINVKQCQKFKVFDYDTTVKCYHSKFEEIGGIHNVLGQLFCTRVPEDKLYIYSHADTSIGQYGDYSGWNLLPWQLELENMFLHANCMQLNDLHFLRAALLRHLKLDRFEHIKSYCAEYPIKSSPFRIGFKKGFPVRRRLFRRFIFDHLFFLAQRSGWILQKFFVPSIKMTPEQEKWFWRNIFIYPNNLLG